MFKIVDLAFAALIFINELYAAASGDTITYN
jgi:hypothetical protein